MRFIGTARPEEFREVNPSPGYRLATLTSLFE